MKISEIITMLQAELAKRGDAEVVLWGYYGADSNVLEVMPDENVSKENRKYLNLWTDISTG